VARGISTGFSTENANHDRISTIVASSLSFAVEAEGSR